MVGRRRRRPTGAGLARLPLGSVVSRLGSAACCRAVAKPRPAHRRTLRARSSHGARRHQQAPLDESAAQPGPRADVGLQPKLMESRVGLDHGDDLEGITDHDPVHQRPRRQQQGPERPARGPKRGQCFHAFGRPGQLPGSLEAAQRRKDLGVKVGGRRHRIGGRDGPPEGLGRGEGADQVDDRGRVDDSDAQRPTSSSSSVRAAATNSGPVGPPA